MSGDDDRFDPEGRSGGEGLPPSPDRREDPSDPATGQASRGRPWISIYFECCRVYARVYRSAEGTAYVGWCPRCARKATVLVGPGGTTSRFFRAT